MTSKKPLVVLPMQGFFGFKGFASSGVVHWAGASAALAGVLLLGVHKGK